MERKYYKNGGRHTAILADGSFIEIHKRLTITSITFGKNKMITTDAPQFDVDSTAKEFLTALEKAMEKSNEILDVLGSCRVCGCTNDDCSQCIKKTGDPCHWVESDLCSACVPADQKCEICKELLKDCTCD